MPKTAPRKRREPLFDSRDFTAYLQEKCAQVAPGDVKTVLAQSSAIQTRAAALGAPRARLRGQVEFALGLVQEHADGGCPQIPYQTLSLLTVALLYFADPVDVIPDWIPGVGSSDDGLVFELAFALARPGIERYCAWKGISTDGLLAPLPSKKAPHGASGKSKAAAKTPRTRTV
ncbi:MAG: YkvA family protein [Candidatus Binatia bacterium]